MRQRNRFAALSVVTLLALAPSRAPAVGGCTSSGCGGNFSATEFKDLAADVFESLRAIQQEKSVIDVEVERFDGDNPVKKRLRIDPEVLRAAFRSVSVVDGQLYLDGKPVSFKSDPNSQHVDFSEKDWQGHPFRISRMRMVIHELLMLSSRKNPELDDYLYDEQLSRALSHLVIDQENRKPAKAKRPQIAYCLMIFRRTAKLDLLYQHTRMFAETANDMEMARQLVIRDCQDTWPKEQELCETSEIRCEPQATRRHYCKLDVRPLLLPGDLSYGGYGLTDLEAEYEARKLCLKVNTWKKCLSTDPRVITTTCSLPEKPEERLRLPPAPEPGAGEGHQHPAL